MPSIQYLGYFPELAAIPASIVNRIRVSLRLPLQLAPVYDQTRTMRRHQTAIREFLLLKPRHSRKARKIAVRTVFESAQVMNNPAAGPHGEPATQRGSLAHIWPSPGKAQF
jgi:hypothetical protein